jgi:hypothetical protein
MNKRVRIKRRHKSSSASRRPTTMSERDETSRKGLRGFFTWLIYYWRLGQQSRHGLPAPLWALSQVISNRSTYGNWAPGTYQP